MEREEAAVIQSAFHKKKKKGFHASEAPTLPYTFTHIPMSKNNMIYLKQ
jgi:hypothetical protein